VIVVDSSALIAIPRREPEAYRFLRIICEADGCPTFLAIRRRRAC
jgi:hypothetical protein